MADISTVEIAIRDALAALIYPSGTAQPSVIGSNVTIFRGWPSGDDLDKALAAGNSQVSIYQRPGMGRTEGQRLDGWELGDPVASTMATAIDAAGLTVTISGAGMLGQIAAVLEGARAWTAPAEGTPAQVAAALQAAIVVDRACTVAGAVLTLPSALNLRARVVAPRIERLVSGQRFQGLQVSCWCPTVPIRDALGALVDGWATGVKFLALPNGERARIIVLTSGQDGDDARQLRLQRRDVLLTVSYPISQTRTVAPTAVGITDLGVATPDGTLDQAPLTIEVLS